MAESGVNWSSQIQRIKTRNDGDLDRHESVGTSNSDTDNNEGNGGGGKDEDFFGGSVYFRHVKIGKQAALNANLIQQEQMQKKAAGTAALTMAKLSRSSSLVKNTMTAYHQQKLHRQANGPSNQLQQTNLPTQTITNSQMNTISLLQQPKWDEFFNSYMEETQQKINVSITLEEFNKLPFYHLDLPAFIIDFVDYLIGLPGLYEQVLTQNLTSKGKQRLGDQSPQSLWEETPSQLLKDLQNGNSEQFKEFEGQFMQLRGEIAQAQFKAIQGAFIVLSGSKVPQQHDAFGIDRSSLIEQYVTEQTLIANFERLFGYRCDIVAKLLYLYLSNGKDCKHINFILFTESFQPLLNDRKEKRNLFVFNLLDVDRDGKLNILNIIQLYKQVQYNTRFGQEIYKLLMEYKTKNILMKQGFRSQIVLNFSTFNKIVPYSSLIGELQFRLFGQIYPIVNEKQNIQPPSPFEPLEDIMDIKQQSGNPFANLGTTADYFLTDQQYENLFREGDMAQASHILAKLK